MIAFDLTSLRVASSIREVENDQVGLLLSAHCGKYQHKRHCGESGTEICQDRKYWKHFNPSVLTFPAVTSRETAKKAFRIVRNGAER